MNAKEMFEKLGLSLKINDLILIRYDDYNSDKPLDNIHFIRVEFRPKERTFCVYEIHRGEHCIPLITFGLYEAIQQQTKELGWVEK